MIPRGLVFGGGLRSKVTEALFGFLIMRVDELSPIGHNLTADVKFKDYLIISVL